MRRNLLAAFASVALMAAVLVVPAGAATGASQRYLVVLAGQQGDSGFVAAGAVSTVMTLVTSAGGAVTNDLSRQIGVLVVESANPAIADTLRASALIEEVGNDFSWQGLPGGGGPEPSADPLESPQWSMQQIHTEQAHAIQAGWRAVDVGILDSGVDGRHVDFQDPLAGGSNVDCGRGHNSVSFLPTGPGVGNPDPCIDNQFHGTHVSGIVAAQANGVGVVGVAPNVTLVPVKVCDASGYCYASAVVDGITYAGDIELDVINMSFFVDDDAFQESTEYKCLDDPTQSAFRIAVERALKYARGQGVTPIAALGNSDDDLANPPEPYDNSCDVVPAESPGVIGTTALGAGSQKATYSNWGAGEADVAAPGGSGTTGDCFNTVLSSVPGGWECFQGTSMASPHAAGVAALIISQFGKLGPDGDVKMPLSKVESYLLSSTIDIGLAGYDECFGHGRIDALRAVQHDTSAAYDAAAPFCPEYSE